MWIIVVLLIIACFFAYAAGRSVFWHRALFRLLCAAIVLWLIFAEFLIANGRLSLNQETSMLLTMPPLALVITAIALRWIFTPLFPRTPPFNSWLALKAAFRRQRPNRIMF
jgi:hypothetical protein